MTELKLKCLIYETGSYHAGKSLTLTARQARDDIKDAYKK